MSYLLATVHYFVYYINTIALYRQEKSILLSNEKNNPHFPKIINKTSLSTLAIRLKMKKCVESLQKQKIGATFNLQNSQLLTLSLPIEEFFSGTRRKSACDKCSRCRFSFSAARNAITIVSKFVIFWFFFSYFGFLPLLVDNEHHCL